MKYALTRLQADVMARLGETPRPQGISAAGDVPWPEDIIGLRCSSMLGEAGAKLIMEAPAQSLQGAPVLACEGSAARPMPSGLYGAEVRLPEGFLRMVSAKMPGWRGSVDRAAEPGSPEWSRQWSAEPGIAGCPERPRAYLDGDGAGRVLRLAAATAGTAAPEWVCGWCVPSLDEDGEFEFPASLYGDLVAALAEKLG